MKKQSPCIPEELTQVLQGKTPPPCLLLGNGLCRTLNKNSAAWSKMLVKKLREQSGAALPKSLPARIQRLSDWDYPVNCPELYTMLLLQDRTPMSKDAREILQSLPKETMKSKAECKMLDYALRRNLQILTLNFDFTIEKYLHFMKRGAQKAPFSEATIRGDEKHTTPSTDRYRLASYVAADVRKEGCPFSEGDDHSSERCAVWHLHGDRQHTKSILCGFEDYLHAIFRYQKLVNPEDGPYASPWDDDFIAKNTWLRLFFTHPIIIAGCALDSDELFLRWLLLRRFRRLAIQGKTKEDLPVFYLFAKHESQDKDRLALRNAYFHALGIQCIEFNDFQTIYNHPVWEG